MFNIGNKNNYENDVKGINALRGLAIDMIHEANSGHPGICLGAASIVYTLFKRHMNLSLENFDYVNRDRFVFSAGHGVPLFYGILYMLGVLELSDLKKLRKLGSNTPGHPEYKATPLVEMSTGPLGQGVATSVGISLSSMFLESKTNGLIDYYTYVLCGDGEMEEGITYEALSLAGTLKLNRLIVLYDSNDVTLDNKLQVSSREDVKKRFESINFNVIIADNTPKSIDEAITNAKNSNLPTAIIVKTIIGEYSKNAGTNIVHGKPLDDDDILNIKEKLGLYEAPFTISQDVIDDFKEVFMSRTKNLYQEFQEKYQKLKDKTIIDMVINNEITYNLNDFNIDYENKALRDLSGEILNEVASKFPLLIGGSADLSSSCKTNLKLEKVFGEDSYDGRNIYFGIREHAMAAIMNGIALSGLRPFGSTFLTFSDYMRPSIRMSALMNLGVIYIFTHDSITTGEDGPTHQPIEQLASLDLIPNLKNYRPFDFNELLGSYIDILEHKNPSCLILPRDNKKISEATKASGVKEGCYVVINNETDDYITLLANGEELGLVMEVSKNLKEIGIDSKVYSVPCLKNMSPELKEKVRCERSIAVTLGSPNYYYELTTNVIGMETFGASGGKQEILEHYGFTPKVLESKILERLNK